MRSLSSDHLAELTAQLKQYPTMKVNIQGHTDKNAGDKYNERLSKNRANSAYRYLIEHGINENRLKLNYYGETKPVDNCPEGNCSAEQNQANRRVEFQIFKD